MKYYIGTEAQMLALDTIITSNCGWPSERTQRWAIPKETTIAGVFAIQVPEGSHGFTKAQMISGISDIQNDNIQFPEGAL